MPLKNATTPFHLFQNKFMLRRCNISTAEGEASGGDRKVGTGFQNWQVKKLNYKKGISLQAYSFTSNSDGGFGFRSENSPFKRRFSNKGAKT